MVDFFSETVAKLAQAKISSPRLEAREIFAAVLQKDVSEIYSGCIVDLEQKQKIEALVDKRLQHCPLDKIIGKKGFYKYDFICTEDVLSPRPETEILVERTLELLPEKQAFEILDLGTGSGCIIESILAKRQQWHGTAVDVSDKALAVAKQNAETLKIVNRLNFINAGWFDADFLNNFTKKFDLIVTNPPYIPQDDIAFLEPEVKDYDPLLALNGGQSGYESYEKIAELTPLLLKDNGNILIEAGAGQARKIAELFENQGLSLQKIVPDLAGIERCVILQKKVAQS